jgi:hypothetical protein
LPRRQFEAYVDKVFALSARVAAMAEGRQSPRHPGPKVWDAVFLGAAMQISSLHRLEAECRGGILAARLGALSEDTMGYALERQEPAEVFALGCEVARRLKRNGLRRSPQTRGRMVVAVDGIEICSSFVRCCDTCMERRVKHQVDGQEREDLQYYHRLVAAVVVTTPFPIPLGIRFQKPGEAEVTCAVELLRELDQQLGRRFFDVLVADALYLQRGFVKEVEASHREGVISLKDNQPELLAEAQRRTDGPAETIPATAPEELQLWHAPEVYWPVADRSVRVVKTGRIQRGNRVRVRAEKGGKKKTKEAVREESTDYYATNLQLGLIPPHFISQLGRSRWRIDTEVFQTLTTQAHLKRPSVHRTRALVVLTMIRVIAYTLSWVFYHRQVVSHARHAVPTFSETARLLGYGFLAPPLDSG